MMDKGVFIRRGGGSGGSTRSPKFLNVFLKSEGKEVERKRKPNKMGGGGLIVKIFWGCDFLEWGCDIFRGVENFSWGG